MNIRKRFKFERLLASARGGKGTWLAADSQSDRQVIMKRQPLPRGIAQDKRLLLQLADAYLNLDHPFLAKPLEVFGDIRDCDHLWLVIEYIEGSHLIPSIKSLPLNSFLDLIGQFCEALSYLHSRNYAHLDLHPQNVLISAPTKGDVYLLHLLDLPFLPLDYLNQCRDFLEFSPNYSAPELISERPVDIRADLYSLGAMLYEVLTGESLLNTGISYDQGSTLTNDDHRLLDQVTPEFLGPIVKKLLCPDPERRFSSAFYLLQEVESCRTKPSQKPNPPRLMPYIPSSAPLVQTAEISNLLGAFERWLKHGPEVIKSQYLICGPKFSGKSRAVKTISLYASINRVAVLSLASDSSPSGYRLTLHSPDISLTQIRTSDVSIGHVVVIPVEFEDTVSPGLLLEYKKSVLVLRPKEVGIFRDSGPSIERHLAIQQIELGVLSEEGCIELLDKLLFPNSISADTKRRLAYDALHLPGAVETVVRHYSSLGFIVRDGVTWNIELVPNPGPLPDSLLANLRQHLSRTVPDLTVLLATLSLIESPLSRSAITSLLDNPSKSVPISPFSSHFPAVMSPNNEETYGPIHNTIRQAILQSLSSSERVGLAVRALQILSIKEQEDFPEITAALARYAWEANDQERALAFAIQASEYYESIGRLEEAFQYTQLALRASQNGVSDNRAPLLARGLELLNKAANHSALVSYATAVEAELEGLRLTDRLRISLMLARSHSQLGKPEKALTFATTAIALATELGSLSDIASCMEVSANLRLSMGQTVLALRDARTSLGLRMRSGQRNLAQYTLSSIAGAYYLQGDYVRALKCLRHAIVANRGEGNYARTLELLNNLGILLMESGSLRRARKVFGRASSLAIKYKNMHSQFLVYGNLAAMHQYSGALDSTVECFHLAQQISKSSGVRFGLHNHLLSRAEALLFRGLVDASLADISIAIDSAREMRDSYGAYSCQIQRGWLYLNLGFHRKACELFRAMLEDEGLDRYRAQSVQCQLGLAAGEIASGNFAPASLLLQKCQAFLSRQHTFLGLTRCLVHGQLARASNEFKSALRIYSLAARKARNGGYLRHLYEIWLQLAQMQLVAGDYEEAGIVIRRLSGLHERIKIRLFEPWLFQAMADHAAGVGEERESKKHLLNARTSLMELAYNINDPDLRKQFLNRADSRALLARSENLEDLAYEGFPEPVESPQATRALESIARINEQLHRRDSLKSTLALIIDEAIRLSDAERGIVFLFDPSGREELKVSRNVGRRSLVDARKYTRTALQRIRHGDIVFATDTLTDPQLSAAESITQLRIRSVACVPLRSRSSIIGALYLDSRRPRLAASPELLKSLEIFSQQAAAALERAIRYFHLADENRRLRETALAGAPDLIGHGKYFTDLKRLMAAAANSDLPVLILGESGTGKELIARAIHYSGKRSRDPFLSVDCGALPENLVESELFGYRRGAFTGADLDKEGLFVAAGGGSLFLDEIGNTSVALQAKLLRAIQEREIRPLGATAPEAFKARLIAATNQDLRLEARNGRFRQDLLFRLNGITIEIPPLRDRKTEIPLLVNHFLYKTHVRYKHQVNRISDEAVHALCRYNWPGNIRELENCIERAVTLAQEETIHLKDLPDSIRSAHLVSWSGKKGEHRLIEEALARFAGDKSRAAEYIGWNRQKLYRKMTQYNIPRDFGRRNTA